MNEEVSSFIEQLVEGIDVSDKENRFRERVLDYIDSLEGFGDYGTIEDVGKNKKILRKNHSISYEFGYNKPLNRFLTTLKYEVNEKCGNNCCSAGRPEYSLIFNSDNMLSRTPQVPGHDLVHLAAIVDEAMRFNLSVYDVEKD